MSKELKPCPFCGKVPDLPTDGSKNIGCMNKTCFSHYGEGTTPNDWNNRPLEDALDKRIAELEAMVEKLNGWIDELINAGNQPRHRNWQDNWDAIVYRIIKEREK